MTSVADPELGRRLAKHHAIYSPFYEGYLSDHGPMAALALLGLGGSSRRVVEYLEAYQARLEPLASAPADYRSYLEDMQRKASRVGIEPLLHSELPALISGWARDAYHPLIRIGYGFQFGVIEEVAAGLAYLKWCGTDARIAGLAETSTIATEPAYAFGALRPCATKVTPERNFNTCLREVVSHPQFVAAAVAGPDDLNAFSRIALDVFAATDDFFALHLVTGAQAYRLLYPFAGPLRSPVFSLGLLAGYAAVGAPATSPPAKALPAGNPPISEGDSEPDWLSLCGEDEHDIKLAFSATCQAAHFDDQAFTTVASAYLRRNGP